MMADDDEDKDFFPPEFEPSGWDVICQRGRENYEHAGNKRFRMLIDSNIRAYEEATTKKKKAQIVTGIVDAIHENHPNGRFVKKNLLKDRWYPISKRAAKEKVAQALRDALKNVRLKVKAAKAKKIKEASASNSPLPSLLGSAVPQALPSAFGSLEESSTPSTNSNFITERTLPTFMVNSSDMLQPIARSPVAARTILTGVGNRKNHAPLPDITKLSAPPSMTMQQQPGSILQPIQWSLSDLDPTPLNEASLAAATMTKHGNMMILPSAASLPPQQPASGIATRTSSSSSSSHFDNFSDVFDY